MKIAVIFLAVSTILLFQNCTSKDTAPGDVESENQNLSQSPIFTFSNLLWIGAHPDDEIPSSPLLKDFCNSPGKTCTLLSLTKGESGQCKLAGGCAPDLPSVRSLEFAQAGQYIGASVEQKSYNDGPAGTLDGVLSNWSASAGSPDDLVSDVADLIDQINPDVILTFDPRHGTTCHPDHRATGQLAVLAAQEAGIPLDSIFMVETVIKGVAGSTALGFRSAVPEDSMTQTYSITDRWEYIGHLMGSIYKSQYYASEVATLSDVAPENRTLSILRADEAIEEDPKYSSLCP